MRKNFYEWLKKETSLTRSTLLNWFVAIFTLLGFAFSFLGYLVNKPIEQDYSDIVSTQNIIIQDFEKVYNLNDATVDISEENICVNIQKNNYKSTMYFDKNKVYSHSETSNTNTPLFIWIIMFSFVGIMVGILLYTLFISICLLISLIIK